MFTPPPADAQIARHLTDVARARRIPSALLQAIAWKESRWRNDRPETDGRVGMMGVPLAGRTDIDRLRRDGRYNIEMGARQLEIAWNRTPILGNGRLDDGRNILECWYFALNRYGGERYARSVFEALASGGEGRFEPVRVSLPSPEKLSWGRNAFVPPVPWHFGDVAPRQRARIVVDLPVPYLQQAWDSPDDFDGSGSCGPCSLAMVLAFYKRLQPHPVFVRDSYPHESPWGGHVPAIDAAVCEPNLGAVHAKMLDYLRPHFPGVAIFYDAKATWERVKAQLDAGRPVILGTQVTPAGHLMVARGYLADGRVIVNDPGGDQTQAARWKRPDGGYSPTGNRYWNGAGAGALYDWDALEVRWVMTFGSEASSGDRPEDAPGSSPGP